MKKRPSESQTYSVSKKQTNQKMEKLPQLLKEGDSSSERQHPFPSTLHLCYQDFSVHVRTNEIAFLLFVLYTALHRFILCLVVLIFFLINCNFFHGFLLSCRKRYRTVEHGGFVCQYHELSETSTTCQTALVTCDHGLA